MWKLIFLVALYLAASVQAKGLQDGHLFEIRNRANKDVVLTAGKSPESGEKVSLEKADDDLNQKWLAVGLDSDDEKFILLPKKQSKFDGKLKGRKDNLPEGVLILSEDKKEQAAVLEKNNDKKSQQWKLVKASDKYFLIKNLSTDRCLKNLDKKKGIFGKLKGEVKDKLNKGSSRAHHSHPELVTCDKSDKQQQWSFEMRD